MKTESFLKGDIEIASDNLKVNQNKDTFSNKSWLNSWLKSWLKSYLERWKKLCGIMILSRSKPAIVTSANADGTSSGNQVLSNLWVLYIFTKLRDHS